MLIIGKKIKHASCELFDLATKKSDHKLEYDVCWKEEFPWHPPVYREEGISESSVTGLLCSVCQCCGTKRHNHSGTWTDKVCTCLRRDMLQ